MLSHRSHRALFLSVIFWVMGCDPSLPDRVAGPRLPVSEEFASRPPPAQRRSRRTSTPHRSAPARPFGSAPSSRWVEHLRLSLEQLGVRVLGGGPRPRHGRILRSV